MKDVSSEKLTPQWFFLPPILQLSKGRDGNGEGKTVFRYYFLFPIIFKNTSGRAILFPSMYKIQHTMRNRVGVKKAITHTAADMYGGLVKKNSLSFYSSGNIAQTNLWLLQYCKIFSSSFLQGPCSELEKTLYLS